MSTDTTTTSETFTITHARHLASKIAADLRLCSNYYGTPSESDIYNYTEELIILLKDGYVSTYEFGFEKNNTRIVSCKYAVRSNGSITTDDRAGKIYSCADISGANFYSFLSYSSAWLALTIEQKAKIQANYKIQRTPGCAPVDGNGYWSNDKTYSAGSTALNRGTFRS